MPLKLKGVPTLAGPKVSETIDLEQIQLMANAYVTTLAAARMPVGAGLESFVQATACILLEIEDLPEEKLINILDEMRAGAEKSYRYRLAEKHKASTN